MGRIGRVLLIAPLLVMLSTGCSEDKTTTYDLPADWPVQQLTLPPGTEIVSQPETLHGDDPDAIKRKWRVEINNSDYDCQAVVAHFESCLRPLGYLEFWYEDPGTEYDSRLGHYVYYSADKLTDVSLSTGIPYVEVDEDLNFETCKDYDYVLIVTVSPVPNRILDYVGTTLPNGTIVHLDPLEQ